MAGGVEPVQPESTDRMLGSTELIYRIDGW